MIIERRGKLALSQSGTLTTKTDITGRRRCLMGRCLNRLITRLRGKKILCGKQGKTQTRLGFVIKPKLTNIFIKDVEMTQDSVNNPKHYTSHPSGVECIEITEHLNFNIGNAIKYLWRASLKGAEVEDLRKARWYVEREIKRVTKQA